MVLICAVLLRAMLIIFWTWGLNVSLESNMMPRNFPCFSNGRVVLLILMGGGRVILHLLGLGGGK